MPTFNNSVGAGFGAGVTGLSVDSGSTTAGVAGLRGRRPDWPRETTAQLKRKLPIRNEIKKRETAVVCDMRFTSGSRSAAL